MGEPLGVRIELTGAVEAPGEYAAIEAFLRSKAGRKLLKRVVRREPGRDLVRALKKEPEGKKALKAVFRDEMSKTKRDRGRMKWPSPAETRRGGEEQRSTLARRI